jgi:asparagine synthase (glutamine-hydrolysing)
LEPNNISASATLASWPQLHSFSIGLENSPDLLAARKAANYLGTVHREYVFTVQEGLDAIPEVIHHLETYDVTTVRASTPMYLLSRKIKAMGVKMVLSGEGSDEIFGGMILFILFLDILTISISSQAISTSTLLQIMHHFIKKAFVA